MNSVLISIMTLALRMCSNFIIKVSFAQKGKKGRKKLKKYLNDRFIIKNYVWCILPC